jgi:hypothetical protein
MPPSGRDDDDATSCWADPANWCLGGQVYCCAEDPRVWVPKPSAPAVHAGWLRFTGAGAGAATASPPIWAGTTLNFAHSEAWGFMAASAGLVTWAVLGSIRDRR